MLLFEHLVGRILINGIIFIFLCTTEYVSVALVCDSDSKFTEEPIVSIRVNIGRCENVSEGRGRGGGAGGFSKGMGIESSGAI
jgi:hypothetical protein